ncbi:hypothetical protein [Streptomyces sp. NPDC096193]|uniref:hypothetical protein n=1 Tax=Streptomyces sp. NPDC096193 TaxID=3155821 RepID=UPI00332EDA08
MPGTIRGAADATATATATATDTDTDTAIGGLVVDMQPPLCYLAAPRPTEAAPTGYAQ